MPGADPTETELKLQLDPTHVDRLRHSALLAKAECSEVSVDNVYFDTADRLLHRHRLALRVREIDGQWLQTLKSERKGGSLKGRALSQRGEWETPARVVRGQGRVDLPRLSASPLPKLLASQKFKPVLRPLFHTRFNRRRWLVQLPNAVVEVALDMGEIGVAGGRATQREPFCEVEVELKQGEPSALIEAALELLDAGSKAPLPLIPVARSKAERGYQLLTQRAVPATKASAKGFVASLTRKTTTSRALREVVSQGLTVLTANAELLLRYDEPEYVHQARVALRRVRSAIRLFDRERRDVPQNLADELRWLARALGEARDWDVITDETLPSLAEGIQLTPALFAKADQQRRQAREKIRSAVQSARYGALVLNGEHWCMTPALADAELLGAAAAPTLNSAARKLFKAARFFAALTAERRHEVRILAKRLRYALDLFAVALPKQATARYIDALSELQDVLGLLNDASVAITVLPQLSKSGQLKKSMQKWLSSIEPDRVRDAETRLLKLSRMEAPW